MLYNCYWLMHVCCIFIKPFLISDSDVPSVTNGRDCVNNNYITTQVNRLIKSTLSVAITDATNAAAVDALSQVIDF